MNLEQICDSVRVRLGVPEADSFFIQPVLIDLVNEAVSTYSVEYDWPWLEANDTFTSVANTESYAVPADWVRTMAITPPSDYPLRYLSLNEVRQRNQVGGLLGSNYPDSYTIHQDQIMLSSIPQSAIVYKHDYIKVEPMLVNPTDQPYIPDQWIYCVIAKAVALGYMRQNDMERAMNWERQYDKWLIRMRDNRRRSVAFPPVRVRPGSML